MELLMMSWNTSAQLRHLVIDICTCSWLRIHVMKISSARVEVVVSMIVAHLSAGAWLMILWCSSIDDQVARVGVQKICTQLMLHLGKLNFVVLEAATYQTT